MGLLKNIKSHPMIFGMAGATICIVCVAAVCISILSNKNSNTELFNTPSSAENDQTKDTLDDYSPQGDMGSIGSQDDEPTPEVQNIYEVTDKHDQEPENNTKSTAKPTDQSPTTPNCDDYHTQYYSEYTQKIYEINSKYTAAINDAVSQCKASGENCRSKRLELEGQWKNEFGNEKENYKTKMNAVNCDPSQYVDF